MSLTGYIEAVSDFQVRGWVWDPEAPEAHCTVEAWRGGEMLGSTIANLHRHDLMAAEVGSGDHAYVLNLDIGLAEGEGALEVFAILGDQREQLSGVDYTPPPPEETPQLTAVPAAATSHQSPVFVLGAARSGTSAMGQALMASGHYAGNGEGHLFGLLKQMLTTIGDFYRDNGEEYAAGRKTLLSQFPADYFRSITRNAFADGMSTLVPSAHWLDKTPTVEMIEVAPVLHEIWPNSRFIFMKRRGLENVASRTRKFPQLAFKDHCTDWANSMRAWRDAQTRLAGKFVEIDQFDMSLNPAGIAALISDFLEIPAVEAERFGQALEVDRPERTTEQFSQVLDFATLDWTEDDKTTFLAICGQEMEEYGYSFDESYYSSLTEMPQTQPPEIDPPQASPPEGDPAGE